MPDWQTACSRWPAAVAPRSLSLEGSPQWKLRSITGEADTRLEIALRRPRPSLRKRRRTPPREHCAAARAVEVPCPLPATRANTTLTRVELVLPRSCPFVGVPRRRSLQPVGEAVGRAPQLPSARPTSQRVATRDGRRRRPPRPTRSVLDDEEIGRLGEEIARQHSAMEPAVDAFVAATGRFLAESYRESARRAITDRPELAKDKGTEGLGPLKEAVEQLVQRAPDLARARLDRDDLWGHRNDPSELGDDNPSKFGPRGSSRYRFSGRRPPQPFDEPIRLLMGEIAGLLGARREQKLVGRSRPALRGYAGLGHAAR
jgi:hypothetical protein